MIKVVEKALGWVQPVRRLGKDLLCVRHLDMCVRFAKRNSLCLKPWVVSRPLCGSWPQMICGLVCSSPRLDKENLDGHRALDNVWGEPIFNSSMGSSGFNSDKIGTRRLQESALSNSANAATITDAHTLSGMLGLLHQCDCFCGSLHFWVYICSKKHV